MNNMKKQLAQKIIQASDETHHGPSEDGGIYTLKCHTHGGKIYLSSKVTPQLNRPYL